MQDNDRGAPQGCSLFLPPTRSQISEAVNLIFLGQQQTGNDILKKVYSNTKDEVEKEFISEFMNKSKQQILSEILQGSQHSAQTQQSN